MKTISSFCILLAAASLSALVCFDYDSMYQTFLFYLGMFPFVISTVIMNDGFSLSIDEDSYVVLLAAISFIHYAVMLKVSVGFSRNWFLRLLILVILHLVSFALSFIYIMFHHEEGY